MSLLSMPPYPWHSTAWDEFVRRLENRRVPHALLITGQDGLGGDSLAKAMAQVLLCQAPHDGLACGRCRSCELLKSGSHPDRLMLEPEEAGKQIKIDQVRQLTDFVGKTPQQGGRKLVILTPAEAMNLNAANALLKNLEEPAGDTVLLLVTRQENRLLPTIRSRCARVVIGHPPREEARQWLQENGHSDGLPLLEDAGGAPLRVVDWLYSDYQEQRQKALNGLEKLAAGQRGPVAVAASLQGMPAGVLVELLLAQVDGLITVKMAPDSDRAAERLNSPLSQLVQILQRISHKFLFRYRDRLCEQKQKLIRNANLNETLFVEELLMDWQALCRAGQ